MHSALDLSENDPLTSNLRAEKKNTKIKKLFKGGNVGKNFALLKHLAQFSTNIIVVLGAEGSGKSSFKNALLAEANTENTFCCITASSAISPEQIKQRLGQEFSINLDSPESRYSTLENFYLIIDDAHNLASTTLQYVLEIALPITSPNLNIHLIMFGRPFLETQLLSSQIDHQKEKIRVLELEALSLKETKEYLHFKWHQANNKNSFPFSKKQIKKIYHIAKGNPKQIEQAAQKLYNDKLISNTQSKKPVLSIILGFIFLFGLSFMGLTYLIKYQEEKLYTTLKAPNTKIEIQQLEELRAELAKEQQLREQLEKWIFEQDKTIEMLKEANSVPEETIAQPKPKLHTPNYDLLPTEVNLLKMNPNNFTLQIIGLSSQNSVIKFIQNNNLTDKALYYRTQLNNKPWYVVVAGEYATQALATAAINNFPTKIQNLRPYPKKLASIHATIYDYNKK